MKKNKQKFVIGETVGITENTRCLMGLPDGYDYEIIDILKLKVDSPYVVTSEELGTGWRGFFSKDELIKIKE